MAEPVLMPQVGQDIKTARIVEWIKKENDEVRKGETIATVESDKAAFDVEAYTSGVLLKILYPEGAEVEVLTPMAYIGQPGEKIEEAVHPPQQTPVISTDEAVTHTGSVGPSARQGHLAASPAARRLAREKGLRLEAVPGTGPGGRITREDVLAAVSQRRDGREAAEAGDTTIVFSPMRARIAERLTRSKQTIPHFYISMDVDMSEAMRWRRQFNEARQTRITVTDMIVKAAARALSQYPKLNAHVEPDKIILKQALNIGVAVSVDEGLIVPVVADADKKNIREISTASRANAEAARAGRLKPQAIGGFTVTNLGMYAVDTFVPVINPPEAAVLAVGIVARRPAVVGGSILPRDVMTMILACDHRAVDGTYAARFLGKIRDYLENPASFED
jgi:pyruvate dehydrogenase E2 component (dihydrolipoamide acetyltransferase)